MSKSKMEIKPIRMTINAGLGAKDDAHASLDKHFHLAAIALQGACRERDTGVAGGAMSEVTSLLTLAGDLESNPERWENATLPRFLDALARYLDGLDGWCANNAPEIDPDAAQWRLFAIALVGATIYE